MSKMFPELLGIFTKTIKTLDCNKNNLPLKQC